MCGSGISPFCRHSCNKRIFLTLYTRLVGGFGSARYVVTYVDITSCASIHTNSKSLAIQLVFCLPLPGPPARKTRIDFVCCVLLSISNSLIVFNICGEYICSPCLSITFSFNNNSFNCMNTSSIRVCVTIVCSLFVLLLLF